MSVERRCKLCGAYEGVRFNFGDNLTDEIKFHMESDGKCMNFSDCKINKIK